VLDFLIFFGTNEIILGVCSLLGIAGFIMTLIVTIKTTKIAKILKYNQVTDTYNKERSQIQHCICIYIPHTGQAKKHSLDKLFVQKNVRSL